MQSTIERLIPGYEGMYLVDMLGDVWSCHEPKSHKKGEWVKLVKHVSRKNGYCYANLKKDGKSHYPRLHRLIAKLFIPIPKKYENIPQSKLEVHHIDFDKTNNAVDNLEWLSKSDHRDKHNNRTVYQYTIDKQFVEKHKNARQASLKTGVCVSNILRVCKGEEGRTQAGGYIWSFYSLSP